MNCRQMYFVPCDMNRSPPRSSVNVDNYVFKFILQIVQNAIYTYMIHVNAV